MKIKLLAAAVISVFTVSIAFAQPPAPPMPRNNEGERKERIWHWQDIMHRMGGLNLSEQQLNDINKLSYDYESKIREAEYRKRGVDYKFEFERRKADIDLNLIKDLIGQRKDIEKELDYLRIEKDVSILKILTPEQRERLNSANNINNQRQYR